MSIIPRETDSDKSLIRKFWAYMVLSVYSMSAIYWDSSYWLNVIGSLCWLHLAWSCTVYLERNGEKQ